MRRLPFRLSHRVFVLPSRRRSLLLAALVAAVSGVASTAAVPAQNVGAFSLTSADFRDGGTIDAKQVLDRASCHGGNRSPQLSWSHPPAGTRSFAVTIFDQDAPGHGWWHWAVARIPAGVLSLPENASASGYLAKLGAVEARNDFDADGYGGPCPPPGKPHRYLVTVYALNVDDPGVAQGRPAAMFDREIRTSSLGSATLTVTYGR